MTTIASTPDVNQTIDAPSARFVFRRFGPEGGVPLVLLNRFRGSLDWWDPEFLALIAAERDVIIFDYVGTGYSSGVPRDSIAGIADGVVEFIDALGLTNVDLLGWSLGGFVAQQIAIDRPALVRTLVVAGSGVGGQLPEAGGLDDLVLELMIKEVATDEDMLHLFFPEGEAARAQGRAHLERVPARANADAVHVDQAAAMAQLQALGGMGGWTEADLRDRLARITQPTLIANGVHDVMVSSFQSYYAVQHLPNATLVLYSDAGHAFLFQHAASFTSTLADFINRSSSSTTTR